MEKTIRRWLLGIAAVGLLAVGAYIGWFAGHLGRGLADDPEQWGQFGDYLGGFLNPLIAAAAFYWLTQSVRIQHREMRAMQAESKKMAAAQEQQAETAALAARLTGFAAALRVMTSEMADLRASKRYLAQEIARAQGNHAIFGLDGEQDNPTYARVQIGFLNKDIAKVQETRDYLLEQVRDLEARMAKRTDAPPANPHES